MYVSVVDPSQHRCRECGDPAMMKADDIGPEWPAYYCTDCASELGIKFDLAAVINRPGRKGWRYRRCSGGQMCYCAPFESEGE